MKTRYRKKIYQGLSDQEIKMRIRKQGFNPVRIHNTPGYEYNPHQHPEMKLIAIVAGSMKVQSAGKTYECTPGDQIIIAGNELHHAIVGKAGCTFFWSEKAIRL
ncbi:MAG TPA: AraC family ligand binding domain-containing protein [Patescibacteria group bacterium]|nr:AraC family ligand binding domain-containing protein [Patescibacteria group bacterium]